MEYYALGKRGVFVNDADGETELFIAFVIGEIAIGQTDEKVARVRPMLAHILANTLQGMLCF